MKQINKSKKSLIAKMTINKGILYTIRELYNAKIPPAKVHYEL